MPNLKKAVGQFVAVAAFFCLLALAFSRVKQLLDFCICAKYTLYLRQIHFVFGQNTK